MVPSGSAAAFQRFLKDRHLELATAALDGFVEAALNFYRTVEPSGLSAIAEADMLLFQFGIYDWGSGDHFEFDITRQFVVDKEEDDEAISQLHCTAFYDPTPALRSIGNGNRWCESRARLAEFKAFVYASDAYRAALELPAKRKDVSWERI